MVGISYLHLGEEENKQFPDWAPNSTCKLHFLFKSFHGLMAGHGLATSSRHMIHMHLYLQLKTRDVTRRPGEFLQVHLEKVQSDVFSDGWNKTGLISIFCGERGGAAARKLLAVEEE